VVCTGVEAFRPPRKSRIAPSRLLIGVHARVTRGRVNIHRPSHVAEAARQARGPDVRSIESEHLAESGIGEVETHYVDPT